MVGSVIYITVILINCQSLIYIKGLYGNDVDIWLEFSRGWWGNASSRLASNLKEYSVMQRVSNWILLHSKLSRSKIDFAILFDLPYYLQANLNFQTRFYIEMLLPSNNATKIVKKALVCLVITKAIARHYML